MSIQAIETVYNGYRFRSRLEARWAVFFDTLGIKWEYEKEGYVLDGIWYLPDFWLPGLEYWIEIKGQKPTCEEIGKVFSLAWHSGKMVHTFWGDVGPPDPREDPTELRCLSYGEFAFYTSEDPNDHMRLGTYSAFKNILEECNLSFPGKPQCLDKTREELTSMLRIGMPDDYKVTIFLQRYGMWVECPECHKIDIAGSNNPLCTNGCHLLLPFTDRLLNAYIMARQARFEHGESPKVGRKKYT